MKTLFLSITVALFTLFGHTANAQLVLKGFYVSMPDSTIYLQNTPAGVPIFNKPGINAIVSRYFVIDFYQAFPSSNYQASRQVYVFHCLDTNLAVDLSRVYPQYFYWSHQLVYNVQPLNINATGFHSNEVLISPNPARERLLIHAKTGVNGKCTITITDILGQVKYQTNGWLAEGMPYEVDIASLANGTYFLSLSTNEHSIIQQKFVKQ